MKVLVKICGNVYKEDSFLVAGEKPDIMGWIFSPKSPRRVFLNEILSVIKELQTEFPEIYHAAVFAENSEEEIMEIFKSGIFDIFQIASDSDFFKRIKLIIENTSRLENQKSFSDGHFQGKRPLLCPAIRVKSEINNDFLLQWGECPFYILDSYVPGKPGGTGTTLNRDLISAVSLPYLLAGGLNEDNVKDSLASTKAAGADVSSGIEDSPGRKNPEKLRKFIQRVRSLKA